MFQSSHEDSAPMLEAITRPAFDNRWNVSTETALRFIKSLLDRARYERACLLTSWLPCQDELHDELIASFDKLIAAGQSLITAMEAPQ